MEKLKSTSKYRKKIPHGIEAEILFINNRTCCICRDSTKGAQIHHIDENPDNNDPNNLAVVCTEHHDDIHKSGGITKGISPTLLKKYKRNWELTVRRQRTQQHYPLKSSLGVEKTLFKFEIRKTAYEILALKDNDTDGINQRLEFLYTIHLLEGYTKEILGDLNNIIVLAAVSDKNKVNLITNKMYEFFWHFVGPESVEITKKDIANLKIAIKTIGTIGEFSAQFNESLEIIKSVSRAFQDIWNILIWYNLESNALMVLDKLDEISRACKTASEDEKAWALGINELSKLYKKLKTIVVEEQPEWKKVLAQLNKV